MGNLILQEEVNNRIFRMNMTTGDLWWVTNEDTGEKTHIGYIMEKTIEGMLSGINNWFEDMNCELAAITKEFAIPDFSGSPFGQPPQYDWDRMKSKAAQRGEWIRNFLRNPPSNDDCEPTKGRKIISVIRWVEAIEKNESVCLNCGSCSPGFSVVYEDTETNWKHCHFCEESARYLARTLSTLI